MRIGPASNNPRRGYANFLAWATEAAHALWAVRAAVATAAVLCWIMLGPDQSFEVFLALFERATTNGGDNFWRSIGIVATGGVIAGFSLWYNARVSTYVYRVTHRRVPRKRRLVLQWAPRLIGFVPILCVIAASVLVLSAAEYEIVEAVKESVPKRNWLETIVALAALVLVGFGQFYFYVRRRKLLRRIRHRTAIGLIRKGSRSVPRGGEQLRLILPWRLKGAVAHLWMIQFFIALATFAFFVICDDPAPAQTITGMGVVFLWVIAIAPFLLLLSIISDQKRIPLIGGLVLWAVVISGFDLTDNHEVQWLRVETADLDREDTRKEVRDAFKEWLDARPDKHKYVDGEYPVILVTADGGGLYAALHTAGVLARLQDACPPFARHTFVISGVSGGSYGASIFAALLRQFPAAMKGDDCYIERLAPPGRLERHVLEIGKEDILAPVLSALLFRDLLQRFVPILRFGSLDRSRALERAFEEAWISGVLAVRMGVHAEPGPASTNLPSVLLSGDISGFWKVDIPKIVLNTTHVESGMVIPIAPFRIDSGAEGGFGASYGSTLSSLISRNISLSTAASLSGRFPGVSSAATVEACRRCGIKNKEELTKFRFVDGGYFENSGTSTIRRILTELVGNGNSPSVRFIVIRIGNPRTSLGDVRYGFGEVLSPVRAIFATRSARIEAEVDMVRQLLVIHQNRRGELRDARPKPSYIEFPLGTEIDQPGFKFWKDKREMPLGWILSKKVREVIVKYYGSPAKCSWFGQNLKADCAALDVLGHLRTK